jgi:CDP-diacylglycerol--glycerol-3-phosphate 3-phosphatidyltransferase
LVPYIRAKARELWNPLFWRNSGTNWSVLIISLAAIGLDGLGVPYVLATGMWALAILGSFTVVQRMLIVKRAI